MFLFRTLNINSFILLIALIFYQSCDDNEIDCTSNPSNVVESFMDIDNNKYHGVKIGNQIWMQENLKTTGYRNGDSIPNIIDNLEWAFLKKGAYCHYGNNNNNKSIYGNLYNWYAINDPRQLSPEGWHIPDFNEWDTLIKYLGGIEIAGGKLKECGVSHWQNPNNGAINEGGFTALPGGLCFDKFFLLGSDGYWWMSNEVDTSFARSLWLHYEFSRIPGGGLSSKDQGLSVRCIKD